MTVVLYAHNPAWIVSLIFAHLVVGVGLGVAYFRTLLWSTFILARGAPTKTVIATTFGRFAALACVLGLASVEGALPLLATTLGVLMGRLIVVNRVREEPL